MAETIKGTTTTAVYVYKVRMQLLLFLIAAVYVYTVRTELLLLLISVRSVSGVSRI